MASSTPRRRGHAEALDARRDQRPRRRHPDVRPELAEQVHVRAQHAAVQEVADDRHLEAGEALLVLADREGVEQRLGRVLVHPVAGVDDARAADLRQQVRGARRGVPHHDHVRRHRFEVERGVDQRLALGDARGRDRDAQGVGAEPLLGDLERHARPRARLEEQVDDGAAAQRRHLLDRARADFLHRLGGVEDQDDLLGRELLDAEQMPAAERRRGGAEAPGRSRSSGAGRRQGEARFNHRSAPRG